MPEFEEHHHHHHHDEDGYSRHRHSSSGEHRHHYDDDGYSHHHHHSSSGEHHHHHHDDDDIITITDPSKLDLGRVGLENKTPRETKIAAVIACMLTVFVMLPVLILLLFKNRSLNDEVVTLRHELGLKMRQIEKLTSDTLVHDGNTGEDTQSGDSSSDYAMASAKSMENDLADATDDAEEDEDEDAEDGYDTVEDVPVAPPAIAVKAASITPEEAGLIRNEITLMPNGMRVVGKGSSATKTSDPIAGVIAQAYSFVVCGQRSDAAVSFKKIVEFKPYWPYGYFYLGLLSGDRDQLEKAAELFEKAELIGASTPESVFYEALTAFYRKADFSAESFVSRLTVRKTNPEALQVGPALYPPTAPMSLIEKLKKIPGMPELVKFTPDWGKK